MFQFICDAGFTNAGTVSPSWSSGCSSVVLSGPFQAGLNFLKKSSFDWLLPGALMPLLGHDSYFVLGASSSFVIISLMRSCSGLSFLPVLLFPGVDFLIAMTLIVLCELSV